ncbi:MAG: hypothetical protein CL927_17680 [Deltaproteobacteria bacterium]|nr:hypothetical protein [Deltaproteobacteria bacterium]HCH65173.1 hypothetical protein [Deltaproteobacteria bacterium]
MPVLPLTPRLFPTLQRTTRVEAAARTGDSAGERPPLVEEVPVAERSADRVPTDPAKVVDALLESLTDAELADLEELSTEDIEVLARQMHLRGLRRQHARGFLDLQV